MGSATIGFGGPWPPNFREINDFFKFTIDFNNFDALAFPNFKPVADPMGYILYLFYTVLYFTTNTPYMTIRVH